MKNRRRVLQPDLTQSAVRPLRRLPCWLA